MERCQHHEHLDWLQYVNDSLVCRDEYDLALETCPRCLDIYVQIVQKDLEAPSPVFTDKVMAGLGKLHHQQAKPGRYNFRPVLHYLVAACLTLAFLELGVFEVIPGLSEQSQDIHRDVDFIGEVLERMRMIIGYLKI